MVGEIIPESRATSVGISISARSDQELASENHLPPFLRYSGAVKVARLGCQRGGFYPSENFTPDDHPRTRTNPCRIVLHKSGALVSVSVNFTDQPVSF